MKAAFRNAQGIQYKSRAGAALHTFLRRIIQVHRLQDFLFAVELVIFYGIKLS